MTAAALGATLAMETFDGPRDLDIRRGTQSGDTITLRGLGVTHLRGTGRGDIVVHTMVQTPTRLDAEQEDLLRRLAVARGEERPEARIGVAGRGLAVRQAARRVQGPVTAAMTLPLHLLTGEALDRPRRRGRRRPRRPGGPARRHRATNPGGGAAPAHRRRGEAGRGAGRRGRRRLAGPRGRRRRPPIPLPNPRFVLVQALAKHDRDEQAVEAATECGVDEVVPWQASRSVVQWRGERGEKARRTWDAVLLAATKQSRRTRRPVLARHGHDGGAGGPGPRRGGGIRAARGRTDAAGERLAPGRR